MGQKLLACKLRPCSTLLYYLRPAPLQHPVIGAVPPLSGAVEPQLASLGATLEELDLSYGPMELDLSGGNGADESPGTLVAPAAEAMQRALGLLGDR